MDKINMNDFYEISVHPRPLQRDEALEMATDLLVKDPAGIGDGHLFFASNISWLTDYSLNVDPGSEDLHYFISAGENFYGQATPEQKDTKTFAECARMLAVALSHIREDSAKIVYYQECASRCPDVKVKLDKFLADSLLAFENLLQKKSSFPELAPVAEAGLAGAKIGSDRAAQWAVIAGLARLHAGDTAAAQGHFETAATSEIAKNIPGYARLQTELKTSRKRTKTRSSLYQKIQAFWPTASVNG